MFSSRADFSADPAFSWMSRLSTEVEMAIRKSKILFCNGYDFDELSPSLLESALECAVESGASIFFDPGPRGKNLIAGRLEEQRTIGKLLRMSEVLLLTSEEVCVSYLQKIFRHTCAFCYPTSQCVALKDITQFCEDQKYNQFLCLHFNVSNNLKELF